MRTNRLLFWLLFLSSGTRFIAGQSAPSISARPAKAAVRQAALQNMASGLKTSASSLSFGNAQLNSPSAPQFITITNGGKSDLTLTEVASSEPDFKLIHNCALSPDLMPAGSSCGISIRFVPGAVGLRNGSLRIAIGGGPPMQPLTIPLQGNGVDSPVTLSQTNLVFRTVLVGMTSMPQFVRLTNQSNTAPAKITSIAASPDFSF